MGRKRLLKLSHILDSVGEKDKSEQALKLYKSSADKDTSQLAFPFLGGLGGLADKARGLFEGGTLETRKPPTDTKPAKTTNPVQLSEEELSPPPIPEKPSTTKFPRFTKLPPAPEVPKDIGKTIKPVRPIKEREAWENIPQPPPYLQSPEVSAPQSTLGYKPVESGSSLRMERDLPGSSPKQHLQETVMSLDEWCDELLAKVDEISSKLSSDINYALGISGMKLSSSTKEIKQAIDNYQYANSLRIASLITGLEKGNTPEQVLKLIGKKSSIRAARLNKIAKLLG